MNWKENNKKYHKCSISNEELFQLYEQETKKNNTMTSSEKF